MIASGRYPESRLNRTMNMININGTIFGYWYYRDGPFDLNSSHHSSPAGWYSFDGAMLNLMSVNSTDNDSFYYDKNLNNNFTSDMIGVFGDSDTIDVDNYELIGGRYIYLLSGNTSGGIVNLTKFFFWMGSSSDIVYMKYQLYPSTNSMYEDLLYVEYFDTYEEAQGYFTSNKIIYERFYRYDFYDTYFPPSSYPSPTIYERITLDRFPISLDDLFIMYNLTLRNLKLDEIGNGTSGHFIVPYVNYFHPGHYPGTMKWYLYMAKHSPISLPIDSYLIWCLERNNNTEILNGSEVYLDYRISLRVSYYIKIDLDHIRVNKSLIDAFENASELDAFGHNSTAVYIPADTVLGFTPNGSALDYIIIDDYCPAIPILGDPVQYYNYMVNPFFYFTKNTQNEILTYYQAQYDRMKQSGRYPESKLNRTYNINENNSLFGLWFYKSGPLALNESHHSWTWYGFDGGMINMLNVNKTDKESFYYDNHLYSNFTDNMIGVYGDSDSTPVDNYTYLGKRYMYLIEGNSTNGIVNLTQFSYNFKKPYDVFMKFMLKPNSTSMYHDELIIEYFDTFSEAQSGFTSNNMTYERYYWKDIQ